MEDEVLLKMEAAITVMQRYVEQGYSLSCAYSGGKDSTCTLVLMLEAIRRAGGTSRQHFVQSADTTIENPTIANFLHAVLDELQLYIEGSALPAQIHVTRPSLASQFVVSTIGRGTLVRTPENGVRDGKRMRACADEWKVRPSGRLRALLGRQATDDGARDIVTVLGIRRPSARKQRPCRRIPWSSSNIGNRRTNCGRRCAGAWRSFTSAVMHARRATSSPRHAMPTSPRARSPERPRVMILLPRADIHTSGADRHRRRPFPGTARTPRLPRQEAEEPT